MRCKVRAILWMIVAAAPGEVLADPYTQSQTIVPPNKLLRSPGNVDMVSGKYGRDEVDLSSGSSISALQLSRVLPAGAPGHSNAFADMASSFDIYITEKKFDRTKADPNYPGNDYRLGVRVGGVTSSFDALASLYGDNAAPAATSKEVREALAYTDGLSSAATRYTYTSKDGLVAVFRPIGGGDCSTAERCAFVDHIVNPNGLRLDFSYGPNPSGAPGVALLSVSSSDGFQINFEQSAFSGQSVITKACLINRAYQYVAAGQGCGGIVAPSVSYGYTVFDSRVFQTSRTDAAGAVWTVNLGHDGDGNITKAYVKPGSAAPWLTNTLIQRQNSENVIEDLVSYQQFATGETYSYSHAVAIFGSASTTPTAGGFYTDGQSNRVTITYATPLDPFPAQGSTGTPGFPQGGTGSGSLVSYKQLTPGPVSVTDALQNSTTYDYCDRGVKAAYPQKTDNCLVTVLQSFTRPNGWRTDLYYAGPGQVSDFKEFDPNGLLPVRVTHRDYGCSSPACFDKATKVTDPNGNVTDFTYDEMHGGVLTETSPAINGVQAQKRYTYAQRTAWMANGSGGYIPAGSPIWVLAQMRFCKAGNANGSGGCASGGADEVVTNYDYGPDAGPNNLLLRGIIVDTGGLNLRTCYSYDALGNRTRETKPRAGLTSCP